MYPQGCPQFSAQLLAHSGNTITVLQYPESVSPKSFPAGFSETSYDPAWRNKGMVRVTVLGLNFRGTLKSCRGKTAVFDYL